MDRKRLTSNERDAFLRLCVALSIIESEPDNIASRMKDDKYIKRDIGLMKRSIRKLIQTLLNTIPTEQFKSLNNDMVNTSYTITSKAKTVTNTETKNAKDAIMSLSYDTIYTLIAGCHDKCLMCSLDKGQRKACKLKKALDMIPNNIQDRDDGDCPYYAII